MQDFKRYDYSITIDDLKRILGEYDGDVFVIINGDYYELKEDPDHDS